MSCMIAFVVLASCFIAFPSLILSDSIDSDTAIKRKDEKDEAMDVLSAVDAVRDFISGEHGKILDQISGEVSGMAEKRGYEVKDISVDDISAEDIVFMYCTAKNSWSGVQTEDFSNALECGRDRLFTYDTEIKDNGTYVYTVYYTGAEYYKSIFGISEETSSRAHEYAAGIEEHVPKTEKGTKEKEKPIPALQPVKRMYSELIRKYAKLYGISEFERLIDAVMMAESGGVGPDVMQSSECPYNTKYPKSPNSITDPSYSLQVGIRYLASCLSEAGCSRPDNLPAMSLAIQGYNYGNGYIEWAKKNYGGYSIENAKEFSEMMKERLGWSVYGNPNYVYDVLKYYSSASKSSDQKFGSPFPGKNWQSAITSEYGYRTDPITGEKSKFHAGVDIAYPAGTPISAVESGTVETVIYSDTGYGYHLILNHGNGVKTLYGHCSAICVKEGDRVSKGQVIAKVGSTGKSTGSHLHLNLYVNGNTVNPLKYIF